MSGVRLQIRGEGDPVLIESNGTLHLDAALKRLADADESVRKPALRDIGGYLKLSHRKRWREGVTPAGEKWVDLSPAYKARKKKKTRRGILVLDGHLRDELAYQIVAGDLEFGTNLIYGATHQFGDETRNIPARPFLGLSTEDEAEVLAIINDHLGRAVGPP